jgi:hypothetical protein
VLQAPLLEKPAGGGWGACTNLSIAADYHGSVVCRGVTPAQLDVFNPREAMTDPTITELDERIAMIRQNTNELIEQATALSCWCCRVGRLVLKQLWIG